MIAILAYPAFASLGPSWPTHSSAQSSSEEEETDASPHSKPPTKHKLAGGSTALLSGSALHPKTFTGEIRFAKGRIGRPTAFSPGTRIERQRKQTGGGPGARSATAQAQDGDGTKEKGGKAPSATENPAPAFLSAKTEFKTFGVGDGGLNGAYLGFAPPTQRFELNKVKELKMDFSTKDEWVKVSLRQSESSYQADPVYLFSIAGGKPFGDYLGGKFEQLKARFLFNNQAIGVARQERVDVKLLDSELIKLTGFAAHALTGDAYYSDMARRHANDDFAVSNRDGVSLGEKFSIGPISLTSKFKRNERSTGGNAPSERSQDHTVLLDLEDMWRRLGVRPPVLSALSPSNLYAGVFRRSTVFKSPSDGPPDETKGITAGAYWGWENGSLDASYFKYFLNSRRLGDQNYDSAGRGVSLSLSAWTDQIVTSGGLSWTQSNVLPAGASNETRELDAYASSTFKLKAIPDVFLELVGSRYSYTDQSSNYNSNKWSSSIGLDFSKYLPVLSRVEKSRPSEFNFNKASLRLLYRYQSGLDFVAAGQRGPTGHFVGFSFRTALN